jgi:hypothetical protein
MYPHELAASITALVGLPAVAVIAFLLTPYSRRHRGIPWLLAPLIYIAVAVVGFIVAVNLGLMEP